MASDGVRAMKTVADLKRRLIPGAVLATRYLDPTFHKGDPPPRRIMGGKGVLRMEACEWSNGQESRFEIPSAAHILITGPDTFIVNDVLAREYTILRDAS